MALLSDWITMPSIFVILVSSCMGVILCGKIDHRIGSVRPDEELLVKDGEYPFVVHVSTGCTGSLISRDVVLTAKHCLDEVIYLNPFKIIYVTYGSVDRSKGKTVPVAMLQPHPYYFVKNDIALLKLSRRVEKNIRLAELTSSEYKIKRGSRVTVVGFGTYRKGDDAFNIEEQDSNNLRKVEFPVQRCHCKDVYPENPLSLVYNITNSGKGRFICSFNNSEILCSGDSGGPVLNRKGKLYAIVTTNDKTERNNVTGCQGPSVMLPVRYHFKWIQDTLELLSRY